MIKVKALAVMTRPELEKALADVNVTRRLQHKLLELQQAQVRVLREALNTFLDRHIELVNSGDCGCWDAENDAEVKQARAALAATEPRP